MSGYKVCVEQLIAAGASLEMEPNNLGSSLLHEVVTAGQTECVQILCNYGAQIDAQCSKASTPLSAAAENDQLECIQILLEHQADPNLAPERGCTPLMTAIRTAKPQSAIIVEALLCAGADFTARTDKGDNALHMAARGDQTQVVTMLLYAGASTAIVNEANQRPQDGAKSDSATYTLLRAWDTDHPHGEPMRQDTQRGHGTMKRGTEKVKTTPRGWTRRPRRTDKHGHLHQAP